MRIVILLLLISAACETQSEGDFQYTLSKPIEIGDSVSLAPFLTEDLDGNLILTWTEKSGDSARLFMSRFNGSWQDPTEIAHGANWFINWADYPVIAPGAKNILLASYLQKSAAGTYDYDIHLRQSSDNGTSWQDAGRLNTDSVSAEHGFVSITPYSNQFFATWLDGRNTVPHGEDHTATGGAMTLRAAFLDDGTRTEWEVDPRVCDCCQTAGAISANGPVVVYRDRSENETRDIYISRLVDGVWTAPKAVFNDNWVINGCPVNGPRIAASGNNLAVAWFTAAGGVPSVKVAFSGNNGESFTEPALLTNTEATGRVDIVWVDNNHVLVTFMTAGKIRGSIVARDGRIIQEIDITETDDSRKSGFPQLAKAGNELFMAWTDPEIGKIKVSSVKFH